MEGVGAVDVVRVEEGAHGQVGEPRTDLVFGEFVAAWCGLGEGVMVLVDDLQALVSAAGSGRCTVAGRLRSSTAPE